MAIHMLNICVDMPDASPDSIPEDLSYNDQESILEMLLEQAFNIEDAIAEHDEADDNSSSLSLEMFQDVIIHADEDLIEMNNWVDHSRSVTPYKRNYSFFYLKEINPPPPKG